ncbi:HEPN domain-containing protein [Gordonia terrae]
MRKAYRSLLETIRDLSNALLPDIDPRSRYADDAILRMFAFRLSAHAELEAFMESCAVEMVEAYARKLQTNSLSVKIQRLLLLHQGMVNTYPPVTLSVRTGYDKEVTNQVKKLLAAHQSKIDANNGVSEKDILKLFVPLGVDLSFFETDWLESLNRLASSRGDAAHRSWILEGARAQPDPRAERELLARPLLGTRNLVNRVETMISWA